MLKHLSSLLCLKWVLHYGKIEWYCGTKSFTYGYFAVLKKILLVLLWYDSGVHISCLNLGGMLKLSFALSLSIYASFQLLDLQILCLSHLLVCLHIHVGKWFYIKTVATVGADLSLVAFASNWKIVNIYN